MGSSITSVNSFNPATLLSALLSPTSSAASSTTTTNGVSAQQELSAMQQSGDYLVQARKGYYAIAAKGV